MRDTAPFGVLHREVGAALVGAALARALATAVQTFATGAVKAVTATAGVLRTVVNSITGFVARAFENTFNFVAPVVGAMGVLIGEVFTVIRETIKGTWIIVRDATIAVWQSISDTVFSALDWIKTATINTLSTISFAWNNWGILIDTAVTSAMLSVVRFANQTVHLFSKVIPTWLAWLFDNWRDIFTDIANVTKTVATNIWKNLSNLWEAIVDLFNGEGFTFEWTPLTEGFESAIKELPKIAKREMGPLEKSLQAELDGMAAELVRRNQEHQEAFAKAAAGFTPAALDLGGGGDGDGNDSGKTLADQLDAFLAAIPTVGAPRRQVAASFSLAALQGQIGNGDSPTRAIERLAKQLERENRRLLNEVRDGGTLGR